MKLFQATTILLMLLVAGCATPAPDAAAVPPAQTEPGQGSGSNLIEGDDAQAGSDRKFEQTNQPPSSPRLLAPAGGAHVAAEVEFKWSAVRDPDGHVVTYRIEIFRNDGELKIIRPMSTRTSVQLELEAGGDYSWRVFASDGELETPSQFGRFTTELPNRAPPAAALTSPAHGATLNPEDGVFFNWQASVDPDGDEVTYMITVRDDAGNIVELHSLSAHERPFEAAYHGGRSYTWYVDASDGELTTRSESRTFTLRPEWRVIYVSPVPDYVPAARRAEVAAAVLDAVEAWHGVDGHRVRAVTSTEGADSRLDFIKEWGGHSDTTRGVAYGSTIAQVGLGDSQCNGKWTPYSVKTVRHIAEHEAGHLLGYGHVNEPRVMRSPGPPTIYHGPCELYASTQDVEAGSYRYWNFETSTLVRYHVSVNVGSTNSMQICVVRGGSESCTAKASSSTTWFDVSNESVQLRIRCTNWFDTCSASYVISREWW